MTTKFLKGECRQCGGHIEFPVEATGTTADCPHCGKPTELLLTTPPSQSSIPRKTIVFTVATIAILLVGVALLLAALKRAKRLAEQKKDTAPVVVQKAAVVPPAEPLALADFRASAVTLEKPQSGSLIYAVGTIRNTANRQRFGVRIELELYDAGGKKIGDTKDYKDVIEPNAEWRFQAQVLDKKAASAKLTSIKEDK